MNKESLTQIVLPTYAHTHRLGTVHNATIIIYQLYTDTVDDTKL